MLEFYRTFAYELETGMRIWICIQNRDMKKWNREKKMG
jgi:predicted RNA-binding protein